MSDPKISAPVLKSKIVIPSELNPLALLSVSFFIAGRGKKSLGGNNALWRTLFLDLLFLSSHFLLNCVQLPKLFSMVVTSCKIIYPSGQPCSYTFLTMFTIIGIVIIYFLNIGDLLCVKGPTQSSYFSSL